MPDQYTKNLTEHLLNSLDKSFGIYSANIDTCIQLFSEEPVHDLRVSIRRFIACIRFINDIIPNYYYKEFRALLKQEFKSFTILRDTQVQILTLGELTYRFPVLYTFYNKLLCDEQKLIESLKIKIASFEDDEIGSLAFFLKLYIRQKLPKIKADFSIFDEIGRKRYEAVSRLIDMVDPEKVDTIHKVRLEFKKFRYTMEIIQSYIGIGQEELKRMKAFQTIMGLIQDNRVMLRNLRKFIGKQEEIPETAYGPAIAFLLNERHELVKNFMKAINKHDKFGLKI